MNRIQPVTIVAPRHRVSARRTRLWGAALAILFAVFLLPACRESAVQGPATPQTSQPKVDQPLPAVIIERAWSPVPEMTAVVPDAGYKLLCIQLALGGPDSTTLTVPETLVIDSSGKSSIPVGAGAFSSSDLAPFAGFVSGWRIISDTAGSKVKIGRDAQKEPISMVLTGKTAKLFVLYIVADRETSFQLKVGGARALPVTLAPSK